MNESSNSGVEPTCVGTGSVSPFLMSRVATVNQMAWLWWRYFPETGSERNTESCPFFSDPRQSLVAVINSAIHAFRAKH